MTGSSLPPPPPPPPPPRPAASNPRSEWKDPGRPPVIPFPPSARWGLGDAFSSFAVFVLTSVALIGIVTVIAGDFSLNSAWLPLLVAGPQIAQGLFVWWVARAKGTGVDFDYGMRFKPVDILIGLVLVVLGLIGATFVAAVMAAAGIEPPTASVADLVEDAADEGSTGVTIWIVLVAAFATTAVPVIEELVYRGLWWSALLKRGVSEWWALMITSTVFAAAHFEPTRFPILFALGFALGVGRLLTGRIGASIVTHAVINSFGMIGLLLTV